MRYRLDEVAWNEVLTNAKNAANGVNTEAINADMSITSKSYFTEVNELAETLTVLITHYIQTALTDLNKMHEAGQRMVSHDAEASRQLRLSSDHTPMERQDHQAQ